MGPDPFLSHLEAMASANAPRLEEVAGLMLEVVERDGLIYTAGTGHSTALVLETFYRAGGLACIYPLHHPALSPLEGAAASTLLERAEELGELLVRRAGPRPGELGFVFSNSGVNPVPVGIAAALREAGVTVVAVVSLPHLGQAPARAGRKLDAVADHVLDTMVPYGDAVHGAGGGPATAALSSLCGVHLWNLLLVRLAEGAAAAGVELPIWASSNVEGGDRRNLALLESYRPRIPLL